MSARTLVNAVVVRAEAQTLAILRGMAAGDQVTTGKAPAIVVARQGGADQSRLVLQLANGRQLALRPADFHAMIAGKSLTVIRPEAPERLREQRFIAHAGDALHTVAYAAPVPVRKPRQKKSA